MKISRHIYDFCNRLLLPAVVGVLAVSCIDDSSLCLEDQPDFDPADNVWLSLEVKNQGVAGIDRAATRAGNISDPDASGHPSEEASEAENYINPQDLTLVFFDANGRAMKTLSNDELTLTTIDATKGDYKVVAQVNRAYFTFAAGKMSILAVANAHGINNPTLSADDYKAVPWQASLADLTSQLRKFQYSGTDTSGAAWQPDRDAGRHIPMAGYEANIPLDEKTLAALDTAISADKAFELRTIVMQRSMAKIRVLDGVQFQDAFTSRNHIRSVVLRNGTYYGAIVPDVNQQGIGGWRNGTTIIEYATKPSPAEGWFFPDEKITFQFTNNGTFKGKDKDNVERDFPEWICYTPEMQVKNLNLHQDYRPYLEIVTENEQGRLKEHTVHLEEILDRSDIVRNHIYQFYVTMNEFSAELDVHVVDWEDNTIQWDYTENPGITDDGYLQWENLQDEPDKDTATGILKSDMTPAIATFDIETPINATWRAVFIPITGPQDAFVFLDENDNELSSISGTVDGNPAKLRIKPRYNTATENYSAYLQILVTTVDGRTMNVNVLQGGGYGSNKYFTIVQNMTL